jgi:RNA polymerase sigma-70 factor (ECF subfamily)
VGNSRDDAFAAFYRENWPRVAGYSVGLTRSGHVGDDIAQEAFTRLYARWGRPADPLAYVYRIAHNLAIDHGRRAALERQTLVDSTPPPDHGLLDAVRRLPPRIRDVTLLHYYADLTIEHVAATLKRPPGTVKRQLHEARALLANVLEETP